MANHNKVGKKGEDIAVDFLTNKGYGIIARNWKKQHAEIDIIAVDTSFLVFVEVKTRSSRAWGEPEDAISEQKIKQLIKGASLYIREHDIGDLEPRFDIVSIVLKDGEPEIEHIDDAFYPPIE